MSTDIIFYLLFLGAAYVFLIVAIVISMFFINKITTKRKRAKAWGPHTVYHFDKKA